MEFQVYKEVLWSVFSVCWQALAMKGTEYKTIEDAVANCSEPFFVVIGAPADHQGQVYHAVCIVERYIGRFHVTQTLLVETSGVPELIKFPHVFKPGQADLP